MQMSPNGSNSVASLLDRRAATLNSERSRLSARVADLLARMILEEDLEPGDRLPSERQMLEQFGIGRASLREALRLLETDGLVRMRMGPNGGPVIAYPEIGQVTRILFLFLITSGATLRDIYAVRAAIDPATARLAALHASPEDIARVAQATERLTETLSNEQAFLEENAIFHRLIAEICGNPMLTAVSLSMLSILDGHEAGVRYRLPARRSVVALHEAITQAIVSRDGDAAAGAATDHIETAVRYFERRYPKSLDEVLRPTDFVGYSS
jgi:DNA-binding FadR family transcriptional regulator